MTAKKAGCANNSVAAPRREKKRNNATLTIINGCFAGLDIKLGKARTVLGSDIECDVCLDHSFVSSEHAAIRSTDDGFTIEDLNSRNGTTVNGQQINSRRLRSGDMIEIGSFQLKFACGSAK